MYTLASWRKKATVDNNLILLTDEEKYDFQKIPEQVRKKSKLVDLSPLDWDQWLTPHGTIAKRSYLIEAIKHDLNLLNVSADKKSLVRIAKTLRYLTPAKDPNENRANLWFLLELPEGIQHLIYDLYLMFIAPRPDYKPGYHIDCDGVMFDTAGAVVAAVYSEPIGGTSFGDYLRVSVEVAGHTFTPENMYVFPAGVSLGEVARLTSVHSLLVMCDRAETPISVDGILMGGQDTVSAGEVLEQVRAGMRKLGVENLRPKYGILT